MAGSEPVPRSGVRQATPAHRPGLAIVMMLGSMLAFASMDGISKLLVQQLPIPQILWVRYILFTLFVAILLRRKKIELTWWVPPGDQPGGALAVERPFALHVAFRNHGIRRLRILRVKVLGSDALELPDTVEALVPAGKQVDSFLIHVAVPKSVRRTSESLVVQGSIEFARPVIGFVSFQPSRLTDLLGNPSTVYPGDKWTGLEDSIDGDKDRGDLLRLSDDRRTLDFRLHIHGREAAEEEDFVDQVRVLVEANQLR